MTPAGEILQEYPLGTIPVIIGRVAPADIVLFKDKQVSRRHTSVRYEQGHYVLRDERSANGTFVNGERLGEAVPHMLQDGDQVKIGQHLLVFHAQQDTAEPL
jgi:pSer/pThr/pTyr-binding forkhead associated (FHA) protein